MQKHAMCSRSNKVKATIIPGHGGKKEGMGTWLIKLCQKGPEEQTEIVNIG